MALFYDHYDQNPSGYCFLVQIRVLLIEPRLACKQTLHLGELREVTRELHAIGDASARGFVRHDWRACT